MPLRPVTYSRNVFLPLTTVCRNRCGYCGFRRPLGPGSIMGPEEVTAVLAHGAATGCTEALFTFGERPGDVPGFSDRLKMLGYTDIIGYCEAMCRISIATGLLPHTNAGLLSREEMARLAGVNASMGLMLETTAKIRAHRDSPGKDPALRIALIEDAGELRIPFTTGLLLGIGETMEDREDSLSVIRDLHRRYGHIQEVIIQNLCPKEGTPMAGIQGPETDEICTVIRMAKDILPDEIAVQIPPNLADAGSLIRCGVDDLGGVSPLTPDFINPEHPWPRIDELRQIAGSDVCLSERLCIYPRYIRRGWYAPGLEPLIMRLVQKLQQERSPCEEGGADD